MIEAIIFDLDGTIVDLPIDYEKLFGECREIMHVDTVRPWLTTVSKADLETRKRVFEAWDKAEHACREGISLKEGGMKIYHQNTDKPKGLVTLQGKKIVLAILEQFGFKFGAVIAREDSLSRAEQLRLAAKKLGVDMAKVLFVGNTDRDAEAAREVGCQFQMIQ